MSLPVFDFFAGLQDREKNLSDPLPEHLCPVIRYGTFTPYLKYPREPPPPAPPFDDDCVCLYYGFEISDQMISDWEAKNPEKNIHAKYDNSVVVIPRLMSSVCERVGLGQGPSYQMSLAQERRESSPCKKDVVRELLLKVAEELGAEGPQWIKV
ncbi:hypothetical protein BT96DRAFT_915606 [Gymnopus androsaceus JB14]|uniref:Uncharacterized protein n=1 Tax=Gymnopus androsaceus JB14 TaxID=1447944 RepID=A0A6A4I9V7_9AGAR|nr:hypothetical protein BT96DRAFT_915606 [Gymnopus androsaceus JB14]